MTDLLFADGQLPSAGKLWRREPEASLKLLEQNAPNSAFLDQFIGGRRAHSLLCKLMSLKSIFNGSTSCLSRLTLHAVAYLFCQWVCSVNRNPPKMTKPLKKPTDSRLRQ